jgi:signal transduction histidine kinase/CheY-like chemotaxis protein
MDPTQMEDKVTLEQALRRANFLAAAAEVSQNITQILDIDELLPKTVDIICDAYNFYYAGVFLVDEAGEFAVLQAGRGEPGRIMMENHHKLAVGGNSMIGACTARNEARISLDVDTERVWYPNPVLPDTRSEMALPLAIGDRVMGAVTVQSVEAAAFSDEDISSLQAMANQLAIAIENARNRRELEEAHAELVRAKTFEAVATATGDAIHWIGNKAEPIGGSVERVREDVQLLILMAANLLDQAPDALQEQSLAQLLSREAAKIRENSTDLIDTADRLATWPLDKLEKRLSLASILEDLEIVDNAAALIMKVKEELIGPAREQAPRPVMVDDVVKDAITELAILPDVITVEKAQNLPLALADPIQLNRVFVNILKNAQEAMAGQPDPRLNLALESANGFIRVRISDNGPGIPEDELDKIWVTFHSTKTHQGHSGLGLPACRLILEHIGGHISVDSQPEQGTTVTVDLPVYELKRVDTAAEPSRGNILLVDDNDRWQQLAKSTLEAVGYKVTLSGDNYQTGQYHTYDLILIDDLLSHKDSLEIMKQIKAGGAIAKTVAVSSNPRVERTKERKLLGIHNLLPKPYTQASLLSEVRLAVSSIRRGQA